MEREIRGKKQSISVWQPSPNPAAFNIVRIDPSCVPPCCEAAVCLTECLLVRLISGIPLHVIIRQNKSRHIVRMRCTKHIR